MSESSILHITSSLNLGGAERVAVNMVNSLPRENYRLHLCTTRYDGVLAGEVAEDVKRVTLGRNSMFDIKGVLKLVSYLKQHRISLIHAHDTSVFIAALSHLILPSVKVVWHVHGNLEGQLYRQRRFLYQVAAKQVDHVIAVSQPLATWVKGSLGVSASDVSYLPNFVLKKASDDTALPLPGTNGSRIVCVANLRHPKDHLTLISAMTKVVQHQPDAHLLLVGDSPDDDYANKVKQKIKELQLQQHISIIGKRMNVWPILEMCDIGVLSSSSEGMPLSLIEYGMASLPSVATRVGQCAEVLNHGKVGLLVDVGSPGELAQALLDLLALPDKRATLGRAFYHYVQEQYGSDSAIKQICQIYTHLLSAT